MNKLSQSEEWVSIEEDIPLTDPRYTIISVPVDILLTNGTIIKDGFCKIDKKSFMEIMDVQSRNV